MMNANTLSNIVVLFLLSLNILNGSNSVHPCCDPSVVDKPANCVYVYCWASFESPKSIISSEDDSYIAYFDGHSGVYGTFEVENNGEIMIDLDISNLDYKSICGNENELAEIKYNIYNKWAHEDLNDKYGEHDCNEYFIGNLFVNVNNNYAKIINNEILITSGTIDESLYQRSVVFSCVNNNKPLFCSAIQLKDNNNNEIVPQESSFIHNHKPIEPEEASFIHNHKPIEPEGASFIHNHKSIEPEEASFIHNHKEVEPEPEEASFIHNHKSTDPEPEGASFIHNHKPMPEPEEASFIHNHKLVEPEEASFIHNHKSIDPEEASFIHNHKQVEPEESSFIHNHKQMEPEEASFIHNHKSIEPEGASFIHNHKSVGPEPEEASFIHNHKPIEPEQASFIHNHKSVDPEEASFIHNHKVPEEEN